MILIYSLTNKAKDMIIRVLLFLVLNFTALGIGSYFTGPGTSSEWYNSLNQAPWTPPGWVFGAAWTTIMICFAFFMAYAWENTQQRNTLIALFAVQWVLNIIWNPLFFHFKAVSIALVSITALTILVGYFLFAYWPNLKAKALLVAPYFIWLLIATSLNAYIVFKN